MQSIHRRVQSMDFSNRFLRNQEKLKENSIKITSTKKPNKNKKIEKIQRMSTSSSSKTGKGPSKRPEEESKSTSKKNRKHEPINFYQNEAKEHSDDSIHLS